MKVVVCDTSPVSNLLVIGKLSLLRLVYQQVLIPPAVYREITALKTQSLNISEFTNASWIEMIPPGPVELELLDKYKLDAGEKEALALAKFIHADLLLIDEKAGREVARQLGLKTTGLLGTLLQAKKLDHQLSVRQIMNELVEKAGFWVSRDLFDELLKLSGE